MTENFIRDSIEAAQFIAIAGMREGHKIGFRDGMLRAASMCEAKAALHATYLPSPTFQHDQPHPVTGKVDPDFSATCGRRDECSNLAYEIRADIPKADT